MTHSRAESIQFPARDAQPLHGNWFPADEPESALLVASATGVKASFYRHFAAAAAERGHAVLTFDYRGIGASLDGHVRDSRARLHEWGQLDMPAALDELARRVPSVPLRLVGHSAGGQLVGLMDNALQLERIVQVAGSSGWFGGMGWRMRTLGRLLLRGYAPVATRLFGFAPVRRLGWGEDLPAGVALDWGKWCSSPGYVQNAFGKEVERHWFDEIRCPLLNVTATDDRIATAQNVEDILRLFPNAEITRVRRDPAELGIAELGHVGFFRSANRELWDQVWTFLEAGAGTHP